MSGYLDSYFRRAWWGQSAFALSDALHLSASRRETFKRHVYTQPWEVM